MQAIEVDKLNKWFGSLHAVRDVTFSVGRGDVLGFLGPNGAGKSTTMKMIAGFLEPSSGTVRVGGLDVAEQPVAVKRRIGYLPEGAPLYGEMTPAGFLAFVAEVRGLSPAQRDQRIGEVTDKIHLESVLHQRIETLSKGYKRRVGLAQALLHDPEVLILDEPTDGLDPNQKHEVRTLIKAMARDKAIVISTHILEEVEAVCNRAIIIGRGKLLFSGAPAELAARSPLHNAVALSIKGADAAVAKKYLTGLAQVAEVEDLDSADGVRHFRVIPKQRAAIIGAVGEAVRSHGWNVVELRVETGHLDEVFRSITAEFQDLRGGSAT
ncbi:MAG: ABC transporter ATP-binding protein [Gammaproteobacteria bacterium]